MTVKDEATCSPRVRAIAADLRAGMRDADAARQYGVSRQAVSQIRHRFAIPQPPRPPTRRELRQVSPRAPRPNAWTADEVQYLIAHQDETTTDVAVVLGRTVRAVRAKRGELIREGQIVPKGSRWASPGTGKWTRFTPEELALIGDRTLTAPEVAKRTGRSVDVISKRRTSQGVT